MIQPPTPRLLDQVVQYDAPNLCASRSLETWMYLRGKRVEAASFILHQTLYNAPDLKVEPPLHSLNPDPLVSASHRGLDLGRLGVCQAINILVTAPIVILLPTICLGPDRIKNGRQSPTQAFFLLSPEPLHLFSIYPICEFPSVVSYLPILLF
jgi:hypothetical protein